VCKCDWTGWFWINLRYSRFFFTYVYWEGKVLLYIRYSRALETEQFEGRSVTTSRLRTTLHIACAVYSTFIVLRGVWQKSSTSNCWTCLHPLHLQLPDLPPSPTSPTRHPTSPTQPTLTHLLPHNLLTDTRPADYFTMLFVCWVIMMVMAYFFNLMLVGPVTFYTFVFLIPSFLTPSPHPHGLDSPHKLYLFGWLLPESTCPVTVVTCECLRRRSVQSWHCRTF
jgi:hypothetical protein